jgi:predicted nucleic acid-binding protein
MGRKKATRGIESIENKQIVLDTSVLFALADVDYRHQIGLILKKLETNKNEFYYSNLSLYELNKTSKSSTDISKNQRLVSRFQSLPITPDRLKLAGLLFATMKGCHPSLVNKERDLNCDMIIGGTVVENSKALLLTTNKNDFQPPCWEVVAEGRGVKKNKSHGWTLENWYLLKFNYKHFPKEFLSEELLAQYHPAPQVTLLLPATAETVD